MKNFPANSKLSPYSIQAAMSLTATPEYKALEAHVKQLKEKHMRDLFEQNPKRFEEFRSV